MCDLEYRKTRNADLVNRKDEIIRELLRPAWLGNLCHDLNLSHVADDPQACWEYGLNAEPRTVKDIEAFRRVYLLNNFYPKILRWP